MAFKDTTERNAMNYYISDLHIGHENILRFDNRPFADVNEMNNKLIENWNARVRSDDTVPGFEVCDENRYGTAECCYEGG